MTKSRTKEKKNQTGTNCDGKINGLQTVERRQFKSSLESTQLGDMEESLTRELNGRVKMEREREESSEKKR